MRNIWHSKKKKVNSFETSATIVLFILIFIWFIIGFSKTQIATSDEQLEQATQTLKKAVVLCYSTEGSFPPNLYYLQENYGVNIDTDRYIIHYKAYASNLMPEIVLFNRY